MSQHLISTKELSIAEIKEAISLAEKMESLLKNNEPLHILEGKILATLFFEPSTRTRLSLEAAMLRLGGKIINITDAEVSSILKGETIYDTVKNIAQYSDIIAIRHSDSRAPYAALRATDIPIINGGNGAAEHPTQALTDIYTIKKEKRRLDPLTFMFVGDLKYGRTVHSLLHILSLSKKNRFIFVSPKDLALPDEYYKELDKRGISYSITDSWEASLPQADIIYMTRIQKERFFDSKEYEKYENAYILTRDIVEKKCKKDVTILHPLPRVNEIHIDVDNLPNAAYFRQSANGIPMRMAILTLLLEKTEEAEKI